MKAQGANPLGLYSTRLRVYRIEYDGTNCRLKKVYTNWQSQTGAGNCVAKNRVPESKSKRGTAFVVRSDDAR
jgi:hypothetical protein